MSDALQLPEKMNTGAAEQLVENLRAIDGEFLLDARETTYIGALCLQALVAAARLAAERGTSFSIFNLSEEVETQMSLMGVRSKNLMECTV